MEENALMKEKGYSDGEDASVKENALMKDNAVMKD